MEAVQTLSRLNRTYPGKDETYVIDFANEPQTILDAFRMYDDGAELESVQDLDVVYDMQAILDEARFYLPEDLEAFKEARGKALKEPSKQDPLHKKLYAATQRPTDVFNSKLKALGDAIEKWDHAIDKAISADDEKAKNYAEAQRSEFSTQREALLRFKSDLNRFVRVYNYIAQLVELADAELENFAAFAKLFSKRLKGVSPEQIDLSGLTLAWTAIKPQKDIEDEGEKDTLKPIGPNEADPNDREKEFLHQIIARMNDLFGDVTDDMGQRHFTAQVVNIAMDNPRVVEQVEKNTKEQALQGDLPDVVKQATVSAMKSHNDLARALLKDGQHMAAFFSLVYDIIKHGEGQGLIE